MKTNNPLLKLLSLALIAVIFVTLSSCSKEEEQTNNTTNSSTPTPTFTDGFGTLAAVTSVTYTNTMGYLIPVEVNTATAAFFSASGSSQLADAGSVTLNSSALTKYDNNAYAYSNLTSPLSFDQIAWQVEGKGNIPGFSKTITRGMPSYSGYSTLPESITKSQGLTISLSGYVSNADSVYVLVNDMKSKVVIKSVKGNAASASLSASELSSLQAGQALLQIVPWNYTIETISGKKFYFVNEAAISKMNVTLN